MVVAKRVNDDREMQKPLYIKGQVKLRRWSRFCNEAHKKLPVETRRSDLILFPMK